MKNLQMNDLINEINIALKVTIPQSNLNTDLEESMLYSLNAGGKRLRPVLLLLTLDMLEVDYQKECKLL